MKKFNLKLAALALLSYGLLFSTASQAIDLKKAIKDCHNYDEKEKASACLDNVMNKADKELALWINNQEFTLTEQMKVTGRKGAVSVFRRSQRDFESFRTNNCRWYYLTEMTESKSDLVYKSCYINVTNFRIKELIEASERATSF